MSEVRAEETAGPFGGADPDELDDTALDLVVGGLDRAWVPTEDDVVGPPTAHERPDTRFPSA